uniref:Uncharacterized protein n=1 Tax=viral metagenome TaxID=1070528 RepID=A0A6C0H7Q5_9ZZZZ
MSIKLRWGDLSDSEEDTNIQKLSNNNTIKNITNQINISNSTNNNIKFKIRWGDLSDSENENDINLEELPNNDQNNISNSINNNIKLRWSNFSDSENENDTNIEKLPNNNINIEYKNLPIDNNSTNNIKNLDNIFNIIFNNMNNSIYWDGIILIPVPIFLINNISIPYKDWKYCQIENCSCNNMSYAVRWKNGIPQCNENCKLTKSSRYGRNNNFLIYRKRICIEGSKCLSLDILDPILASTGRGLNWICLNCKNYQTQLSNRLIK